MSLFVILTIIQALLAAALVGVVLMQRSEGGGLGIGGNPSGALGARGAADFLSRSTRWLAIAFVGMSILLAVVAVGEARVGDVDTTLDRNVSAPASGGNSDDLLGDPLGEALEDDVPLDGTGAATSSGDPLADPAGTGTD